MYTFDIFCFGYEMAENKELNNLLWEFDLVFNTTINGREWKITFPYHGGQVSGDTSSCIFGTIITDSDGNRGYTKEIRNANESDYIEDCIQDLENNMGIEDDYDELVPKLKNFINNNEPCFYSIEASS